MVCTFGADGRRKSTNRSFTRLCQEEEQQREAEENRDGQCQGRPEGKKYRLDQDWQSNQEQRSLEEPCKSLIISMLMEERKEEKKNNSQFNAGISVRNSVPHHVQ